MRWHARSTARTLAAASTGRITLTRRSAGESLCDTAAQPFTDSYPRSLLRSNKFTLGSYYDNKNLITGAKYCDATKEREGNDCNAYNMGRFDNWTHAFDQCWKVGE
jgi:hypothetical protein